MIIRRCVLESEQGKILNECHGYHDPGSIPGNGAIKLVGPDQSIYTSL